MSSQHERPPSHLFAVRLWLEEFADGGSECRGEVQHVLSGETRYFREWADLLGFLLAGVAANPQTIPPPANLGGDDCT